jgi:MOSC domain
MHFIGVIQRLQVQTTSLKVGDRTRRSYDPAGIRAVTKLAITTGGVIGLDEADNRIEDVHHRNHPGSKNRGDNGISLGFTSHYQEMRQAFGEHVADGIAGENILIEQVQLIGEEDLRQGVAIETTSGGLVQLDNLIVATPCVEFSRFAMRFPADQRPDETVTETLQFLNDGMRGYYASYSGEEAVVRVGDRVFVRWSED